MFWKIPGPKRSAEITIEKPINMVWDIVTDSNNFSDIIRGSWYWGKFDRETAQAGTNFQKGNIPNSGDEITNWNYYIVNWKPPYQFSMGNNANSWEYDFSLKEVENKTIVKFTRQFDVLGFLPFYQEQVDYTVNALREKCLQ